MNIVEALKSLRPGAEWSISGFDYENLEWLDANQDKPTKEEVEAEVEKLQQEWKDTEYQRQRQPEYPPITDYLDACYWASKGDTTKLDEYYAKCEAVKSKYPKP